MVKDFISLFFGAGFSNASFCILLKVEAIPPKSGNLVLTWTSNLDFCRLFFLVNIKVLFEFFKF